MSSVCVAVCVGVCVVSFAIVLTRTQGRFQPRVSPQELPRTKLPPQDRVRSLTLSHPKPLAECSGTKVAELLAPGIEEGVILILRVLGCVVRLSHSLRSRGM